MHFQNAPLRASERLSLASERLSLPANFPSMDLNNVHVEGPQPSISGARIGSRPAVSGRASPADPIAEHLRFHGSWHGGRVGSDSRGARLRANGWSSRGAASASSYDQHDPCGALLRADGCSSCRASPADPIAEHLRFHGSWHGGRVGRDSRGARLRANGWSSRGAASASSYDQHDPCGALLRADGCSSCRASPADPIAEHLRFHGSWHGGRVGRDSRGARLRANGWSSRGAASASSYDQHDPCGALLRADGCSSCRAQPGRAPIAEHLRFHGRGTAVELEEILAEPAFAPARLEQPRRRLRLLLRPA